MKHYKFGVPEGRFVGYAGEWEVHTRSISKRKIGDVANNNSNGGDGEFWFDYGPAAGGMLEAVGIRHLTPGEMITRSEVDYNVKCRNIGVTGKSVLDALLQVERINGFHSVSHAVSFSMAVEDALGIEVNEHVVFSRMLLMELERIRSHLEVLKRMCQPAGFGVPASQIGYLKEEVSRIISDISGHRYFFSTVGPGLCINIPEGRLNALNNIIDQFRKIYDGLMLSKIFLNRLQNNGIIHSERMVGPAARASGLKHDARLDSEGGYASIGFEPLIQKEGDCFSRFVLRSEEILQSADLIGEISKEVRKEELSNIVPVGSGEGGARIESPQGDLFYYVNVEDGLMKDMKMASPSLVNIENYAESMKGNIFTDFHFNWESFGIWISEAGVIFS